MRIDALRPVLEALAEPHLLVSSRGEILAANPPAVRLLGLADGAAGSLVGLVSDPPEQVLAYLAICSGSASPLPGAFSFRGPEGSRQKYRCKGAVLKPVTTPATILLGLNPLDASVARSRALSAKVEELTREIHARRSAEEELRESEAFNRRLVESSGDCIKVLDLQGRLLSMNPAGQRMLQIPDLAPLLGTPWLDFWEGEHRPTAHRALEAAQAGGEGRFQGFCPTVSGEPRWWDVMLTSVLDGEGRPFRLLVVSRDVTGQRETEEDLRRARDAAESASRVKSRFLAVMSHELRTPLAAIMGYADLMASDVYGPTSDVQRAQLGRIKAGAWHLVSIIEEILTFSRIEAGKEEVHSEPLDLAQLALDSAALVEPQAVAKGVELRVEIPASPLEVESDGGKLRQIVLNLLGNAVKFTDAGYVELSLEHRDGEVVFRVRDTGPGIPADQVEQIFQPFTQLDQSLTRVKGGTGLGLTVSRRLAQLLGGQVSVEESRPAAGTTFVVRLPLVGVPAVGVPTPTPETGSVPAR